MTAQFATWTDETMSVINKLTSAIKGKAFNPEWFLLRLRFEEFERRVDAAEKKLLEFQIEWGVKEIRRLTYLKMVPKRRLK